MLSLLRITDNEGATTSSGLAVQLLISASFPEANFYLNEVCNCGALLQTHSRGGSERINYTSNRRVRSPPENEDFILICAIIVILTLSRS